jgi:hypothetical protein
MRDIHIAVIDDNREIVGRYAIGSCDNQVIKLAILESDVTAHQIIYDYRPIGWVSESNGRLDTVTGLSAISTPPIITWVFSPVHLLRSHLLELFGGAVAPVRNAIRKPLVQHLPVPIHAIHLEEWALIGA